MKSETCTVTIFGHDDEITQDVNVEYEMEETFQRFYEVTHCKVVEPLSVWPSDLKADIELALQFLIGRGAIVKIICKIQVVIESQTVKV